MYTAESIQTVEIGGERIGLKPLNWKESLEYMAAVKDLRMESGNINQDSLNKIVPIIISKLSPPEGVPVEKFINRLILPDFMALIMKLFDISKLTEEKEKN